LNQDQKPTITIACRDKTTKCKEADFEVEFKFKRRIPSAKTGVDQIEEQVITHVSKVSTFEAEINL
jgi:hypothetical protein